MHGLVNLIIEESDVATDWKGPQTYFLIPAY